MKHLNTFILDIFFPKKCINCKKQGVFLCEDCVSLIEINPFQYCLCEKLIKAKKCSHCHSSLDEIFSAVNYDNRIFKKALNEFNNGIKELAFPFSFLILSHLSFLEKSFKGFLMLPLSNESEELVKIISPALKTKTILKLKKEETENKKIILVDSIYEKDSAMEKYAKLLKENGAEKVIGLTVARKIC